MKKEKVTEELVRQNGNQAAAVMADYAGQGGGGGSTGGITKDTQPTFNWREPTEEEQAKFAWVVNLMAVFEINGVLPTVIILPGPNDGDKVVAYLNAVTVTSEGYSVDYASRVGNRTFSYVVTSDWQLIGESGGK